MVKIMNPLMGRMVAPDGMLPTNPPAGGAEIPTVVRDDFKGVWEVFDKMVGAPTDRELKLESFRLMTSLYQHMRTPVEGEDDDLFDIRTVRFHCHVEGEPAAYLDMYLTVGANGAHGQGSLLVVASRALDADGNAPASPEAIANWQVVAGVGMVNTLPLVEIKPTQAGHREMENFYLSILAARADNSPGAAERARRFNEAVQKRQFELRFPDGIPGLE